MCGIVGFLLPDPAQDGRGMEATAAAMAERLRHRGPDDGGSWADAEAGIALGFRRLSILDLSMAGHQPMVSASGASVLVFNGEIYNHRRLREALAAAGAAPNWRGHSDSEALLEALEHLGVERTLALADGMFAFAFWDRRARRLWLGRDRFGEKPLYYGWNNGVFLFGSELKALAAHPGFAAEIDREAIAAFVALGYLPAPRSAFAGIRKLPAGHALAIEAGATPGAWPAPIPYWRIADVARDGARAPFGGSDAEAIDRLEQLLTEAVTERIEADVPLGAFLSGGIDSSTVTALLQRATGRLDTFTIGFEDPRYDEAPFAAAIAAHLGTRHTELRVREAEVLDLVARLPEVHDEPFADASALPTMLLARMTRGAVTVALSGDGGDELFGGYPRYAEAARRFDAARGTPAPLRAAAAWAAAHLPRGAAPFLGRLARRLEERGAADAEAFWASYVRRWRDAPGLVLGADASACLPRPGPAEAASPLSSFLAWDAAVYLPDDLLVKIDRASMAFSLEARAPMLDPEVAAFAFSLPDCFRRRDGQGKWILREVLARHVPRHLFERPKQGFEPPLGAWLRGPLRDWAEELLSPAALSAGGLLDPAPIRARWARHLAGRDHRFELWTILALQAWRRHWAAAIREG
jgi:asparagine synthase (glutamine-hydrolysing)